MQVGGLQQERSRKSAKEKLAGAPEKESKFNEDTLDPSNKKPMQAKIVVFSVALLG